MFNKTIIKIKNKKSHSITHNKINAKKHIG